MKAVLATLSLLALGLLALPAHAQDVGTVAASDPKAEIGRAGSWSEASAGSGIRMGDQLRTDSTGRIRVLFQDESTLSLGNDSLVTVDTNVFDAGGANKSVFNVLKGSVRSLVSDYYEDPLAAYEVETPTSVSGVRGTDFIVIYDEAGTTTTVLCVGGKVDVHSVLDLKDNGVTLRGGEFTEVAKGKFPTPPAQIEQALLRRNLELFDFIGGGRESSSAQPGSGYFDGETVPPGDRASEQDPPSGGSARAADPIPGSPEGLDGRRSTPSDVIGQPIRSVDPAGEIDIRF